MLRERRSVILCFLMLAAAFLAFAMYPKHKIADDVAKVDLEAMIPHVFADWREVQQHSVQVVDPQSKELLGKLYSQILNRTYVNRDGYRIMLSIAYGGDQSDSMQVHKPEICYPAQGFTLLAKRADNLAIEHASIPVTRILTSLERRIEPVTYWTTVGDQVVNGGISKKLIEMSYGLTGKIPDGVLIRVSSIDTEPERAYVMQDRFSVKMLQSLTPQFRQRLGGNP